MNVAMLAVFAGAFRSWHGAIHLVEAIERLRAGGRADIGAVLIGDGPERARVQQAARGIETIAFTGAVAHDRMPAALAAADVGVAPFDVGAHAPLALGFYWSPLKVFEYMAAGLPVVAPNVDRISTLVADGVEGRLYDLPPAAGNSRQSHAAALADALVNLADASVRQRMGAAARDRAVRDYSWTAHCRALGAAITNARGA
jgi:glycosyltransferase involved in cell wall biosynthesis